MRFYLIRHAHAVDLTPDEARPLSERGHEQLRTLAKFLRRSEDFAPTELWHSPLVRARETAERLAKELKFPGLLRETAGLRPEDDPAGIARRLAGCDRSVAVIGHEPHLSTLGTLLVTGAADFPVFEMKKASTLALERVGERWLVRWHIAPAFLA